MGLDNLTRDGFAQLYLACLEIYGKLLYRYLSLCYFFLHIKLKRVHLIHSYLDNTIAIQNQDPNLPPSHPNKENRLKSSLSFLCFTQTQLKTFQLSSIIFANPNLNFPHTSSLISFSHYHRLQFLNRLLSGWGNHFIELLYFASSFPTLSTFFLGKSYSSPPTFFPENFYYISIQI